MGTKGHALEYTMTTGAEYLGVSVSTLRRLVARGEVNAHRVGARLIRFTRDDLDRAVKPVNPATFAARNAA